MDQIGLPLAKGAPGEVTVTFPAGGPGNGPCLAIRARGNLPLLVEDCLLAELPADDLAESWASATRLTAAEAALCCQRAANRLARAFDSGVSAADLADIVANAAVLFVISLKASGIAAPEAIGPCTVTYDGSAATGRVSAAAWALSQFEISALR